MNPARRRLSLAFFAGVIGLGGLALAQPFPARHRPDAGAVPGQTRGPKKSNARPVKASERDAPKAAEHQAHEAHEAHEPRWEEFNWFYGMLGEKEGVPPGVAWRPKGMPAPFGALMLDAALLYLLLFKLMGEPVTRALSERKQRTVRGIEEASKMKREATLQLAQYEEKLEHIDDEIERVRREMREGGEIERQRILREAKERRARMEDEARLLIEQEIKAARETLLRETADAAIRAAERALMTKITPADQQRLADEYLGSLKVAAASLRGRV